jgi:hypothetical protein
MFELAQAVGERRYDWEHKVMVFLKPEELATIMAEPNAGHEFYHDTCKHLAAAGQLDFSSWTASCHQHVHAEAIQSRC